MDGQASVRQKTAERDQFAAETAFFAPLQPANDALPVPARPHEAAPARFLRGAGFRQQGRRLTPDRIIQAAQSAGMLELERGLPFLLLPVFLAIGALGYFSLDFEPNPFVLLAVQASAIVAAVLARGRPMLHLAAMALCLIIFGAVLGRAETWMASTKVLGGEITTNVVGQVEAIDHLANGRVRLTLAVRSTDRPKLRYAPDRIRASAITMPDGLRIGSAVSGLVRLQPPSGPVRPGSYDFSFESYFDRIGASGFFLRGPQLATGKAVDAGSGIAVWIEDARLGIAERIRQRIGGPEGEIAAALMVGVRAGIPEPVNEALRRAGLYHIISISGLHMALVAGTVMGALRVGFALLPGFTSRRPAKKYAAFLAIAAIAAYLFISGGEVAAQRSFIMLAVMLTAVLFDRAALTMRNLAISALVVIVISPHEVVGPSFQMSFAATAALVGAYGYWSQRNTARQGAFVPQKQSAFRAIGRRIGVVIIGLAMTSIIAGLATAAFGAYHFQRVSPLSLAANLAAMPVVSLVVVPSAVLAALSMPFGFDGLLLDAMGLGLKFMVAISIWFSERSPVDAVGLVSPQAVILITIALIVATMATTWLRWGALPFALAGLLTLGQVQTPDLLVAEDGRLVGMATAEGTIAVNRQRAGSFSVDNWKRAFTADTVLVPVKAEAAAGSAKNSTAFRCTQDQCSATHHLGAQIVQTSNTDIAKAACATASVIILADATADLNCKDSSAIVVTSRDLARFGSAAVFLPAKDAAAQPQIRFSIDGTERPWHSHRKFSRAARGLAPYERPVRSRKEPGSALPQQAPATTATAQ